MLLNKITQSPLNRRLDRPSLWTSVPHHWPQIFPFIGLRECASTGYRVCISQYIVRIPKAIVAAARQRRQSGVRFLKCL